MVSMFKKATKLKSRLRLAIEGPGGSGKTFTALRWAMALGGPVAVIQTEAGAIQKYLGLDPDGIPFDFEICDLTDNAPTSYTQAILNAGQCGFKVIVIDSLSHAWTGVGGALEIVDRAGAKAFHDKDGWRKVTPMHNRMVEAILNSPCHVIATMRTKTEYVLEEKNGKTVPRKVGTKPVHREGMEYEFDVIADMDLDHTLSISKTRCPAIDGAVCIKPGAQFIEPVRQWLEEGIDVPADYYAVTEEDLARLEKKQMADMSPKEKAAKAAERAAAKRPKAPPNSSAVEASATSTTKATEPTNGASEEPPFATDAEQAAHAEAVAADAQPATPPQREQIRAIFEKLAWPIEAVEAVLAKRGVKTFRELNVGQANELIEKLNVKLLEQQAESDGDAEALVEGEAAEAHAGN